MSSKLILTLLLICSTGYAKQREFRMNQIVTFKDYFYRDCKGTIVGRTRKDVLIINIVCKTKKITRTLEDVEMRVEELND